MKHEWIDFEQIVSDWINYIKNEWGWSNEQIAAVLEVDTRTIWVWSAKRNLPRRQFRRQLWNLVAAIEAGWEKPASWEEMRELTKRILCGE